MVTLGQLNEIAGMLSEHDSADDDETLRVSVQSMAKLLAELYHLRRQVTELQAHNTARQERARAAAQEREETRAECERMRVERDDARTEMQRAKRAIEEANKASAEAIARVAIERDAALSDAKWGDAAIASIREEIEPKWEHMTVVDYIRGLKRTIDDLRAGQPRAIASSLDGVRRERDDARAECERMRVERDEALAKMEEGAADVVPPELTRLWKAAQGARKKWDGATRHSKLAEECGEYVAAWCKDTDRYTRDHTMHELHDVLTVALSLAEPALMAKAAERLEGRLAE